MKIHVVEIKPVPCHHFFTSDDASCFTFFCHLLIVYHIIFKNQQEFLKNTTIFSSPVFCFYFSILFFNFLAFSRHDYYLLVRRLRAPARANTLSQTLAFGKTATNAPLGYKNGSES